MTTSFDAVELRLEIPRADMAVLDGYCNATGKSRAELVRAILNDWSAARVHEAKIICRVAGVNPFDTEADRK